MQIEHRRPVPAVEHSDGTHEPTEICDQPSFVRKRPSLFRKLFFKAPKYLYFGPVASLLKWRCIMMLTTIGRKSGQPNKTGVSFMQLGDRYIVFSGWGVRSNWYRNLLANPNVKIQVGRQTYSATAHLVEDPDRRVLLMLQMKEQSDRCGPPPFMRPLLQLTRIFDYDNEQRIAIEQGGALPVIEIIPDQAG